MSTPTRPPETAREITVELTFFDAHGNERTDLALGEWVLLDSTLPDLRLSTRVEETAIERCLAHAQAGHQVVYKVCGCDRSDVLVQHGVART